MTETVNIPDEKVGDQEPYVLCDFIGIIYLHLIIPQKMTNID